MPRIRPVDNHSGESPASELLRSVEKQMQTVPNLVATMANSPAVAKAYLDFSQSLASGNLPRRLREQISLVVGEANRCDYCVAAHTALGKAAGLTEQATCEARRAKSDDAKEQITLEFARKLVQNRGVVADADLLHLRQVGYTDGDIVEIVANVALNTFTNYFNHVAGTEVDFPAAPELAAA